VVNGKSVACVHDNMCHFSESSRTAIRLSSFQVCEHCRPQSVIPVFIRIARMDQCSHLCQAEETVSISIVCLELLLRGLSHRQCSWLCHRMLLEVRSGWPMCADIEVVKQVEERVHDPEEYRHREDPGGVRIRARNLRTPSVVPGSTPSFIP
jgi:hypothetical protein